MAMTEQEAALLSVSADLWNGYLALPIEHPSDQAEFMQKIHDLQRHILCRPARREMNAG